ncbi:hypothetical protein XENORESO_021900, partial [Xenotaenia resolanae]
DSVLELPKELRQLDEMHSERRECACKHYPVTERGLLARFSPYPKSETTPAADGHTSKSDSLEVGVPAPHPLPKIVPPDIQQTLRRLSVTSVSSLDASASPQVNPQNEISTNCNQVQVDVMGRGRQFGNEPSSVPSFPSIGRGFLLQRPQPLIPGEGAGRLEKAS